MDRVFGGRLFQSEGALNMKDFFPTDFLTVGVERKYCTECLKLYTVEYSTRNCCKYKCI